MLSGLSGLASMLTGTAPTAESAVEPAGSPFVASSETPRAPSSSAPTFTLDSSGAVQTVPFSAQDNLSEVSPPAAPSAAPPAAPPAAPSAAPSIASAASASPASPTRARASTSQTRTYTPGSSRIVEQPLVLALGAMVDQTVGKYVSAVSTKYGIPREDLAELWQVISRGNSFNVSVQADAKSVAAAAAAALPNTAARAQLQLAAHAPKSTRGSPLLSPLQSETKAATSLKASSKTDSHASTPASSAVSAVATTAVTGTSKSRDEDEMMKQATGKQSKDDDCGDDTDKPVVVEDEEEEAHLEIPNEFSCPILGTLMVDPVVTEDGHTYERSAILHWLKDHDTSPKTMTKLKSKTVVPNHSMRAQIIDFRAQHGLPEEKAWKPDPAAVAASARPSRGAGTSGGVTWSPNQHRQARGIIAGILQNNPHIMMDTGLLRHVQQGVPIAEVAGLVITTPALWNLVVRKFREHPVGRELMRPRDLADRQRKERREAELASRHGANPVVRALQQDDANALAHMIRAGQANPFVNNPQDGSTMLHMATRLGKLSCVKMLCQVLKEAGKHLNAKDVNGSSPLHLASFYGFSACAEHLLEHGADPNEQMVQGDTPVIQAAWNGHNDIIKLLIAAGANANKAKRDGSTALQLAVIRHQHDTVGLLLEQPNVDRALHNTQGNSAVHLACNVGCRQALEMLIVLAVEKRGTDKLDDIHKLLRQKNEGGMAPLHIAAYNGHDELVRIILSTCDTLSEKQELANMRTMPGWTALHAAVERGFLPVVTVLLEEGLADPTAIRLQDGSTPVHISCTMNTSKHHAILRAIIKAIHLRLKSDQAATEGKTDVEVRGLLQQILRKKDTQGFEALNFAIRSPTAMMTLLDHGCDVNTPNGRDGVTPLLQACDSPRPNLCLDVVVRLIARGANVNVRLHANGNGPLHLAAKSGSLEIVRELLAAGADPAYKNVGGIDAATMARQATHIACAELIEESLAPRF